MATGEWYCSGSDSDGEMTTEESGSTSLQLGGIRIPSERVLELMQASVTPGVLLNLLKRQPFCLDDFLISMVLIFNEGIIHPGPVTLYHENVRIDINHRL